MTRALTIHDVLDASTIMAVVTIDDARHAAELARALVRGGVRSIEVTLRTPTALDSIRRIASEVPEALVGAGTVLTPADYHAAAEAGAAFAVSPGSTEALLGAGRDGPIPYLPAIATASEIMRGLSFGYTVFKAFPASVIGGVAALKAFAGPFPGVKFCPTGGITRETAGDYLALANVVCVGGSWLTPANTLETNDWLGIEALAAKSLAALGPDGGRGRD